MTDTSRRLFLKMTAWAGGGLVMGLERWDGKSSLESQTSFQANRLLIFQADGFIRLVTNKTEMGQGTNSTIRILAAEELCISPAKIIQEIRSPDTDHFMGTGGSWGMAGYYRLARPIFATARQLFVNAAAQHWKLDAHLIKVESGRMIHPTKTDTLAYSDLLDLAAGLEAPVEAELIPSPSFKYIGQDHPMAHLNDQVMGKVSFGIDQFQEGMLYASMERCPVAGGQLKTMNEKAALAISGVQKVIPLSGTAWDAYNYRPAGVAVLATNTWQAQEARKVLAVEWEEGDNRKIDNDYIQQVFQDKLRKEGTTFREVGHYIEAMEQADEKIEAVYETPFWSHSPMEPMNTLAHVQEDRCDIWSPCHMQSRLLAATKEITGFEDEQIHIHTTYLGGSFGRRLLVDYAIEALLLSKAANAPVQLLNTRIDETKNGHYLSAGRYQMRAGFKQKQLIGLGIQVAHLSVWSQREPQMLEDGIDNSIGDDLLRYPYHIPVKKYGHHLADEIQIPVSWWRGTYANTSGFVMESWIDELAIYSKQDPLDYRLSLLQNAPDVQTVRGEEVVHKGLFKNVLEAARDKGNWQAKRRKGYGKGIAACFTFFESYAAIVAEVQVIKKQKLRIKKLSCVLDCGVAVNPNMIRAQIEGGIIFALSAMLKASINFENGKVVENSFGDYPTLTYGECPEIEVHILPSDRPASGVGELGNIPTFAAVCNAIYDASGIRIRSLPLSRHLQV